MSQANPSTISSPSSPPTPSRAPRRARLLLTMAVAAAATTLASAWPATAATEPTDTEVSWSVRPADTALGVGRPNFAYEARPGDTLSDALAVTNRSAERLHLQVYAADGFLTADGSLDILASGEQSVELGSWIAVAAPTVSLAPGESTEVPFRLDVPAVVDPGDYAAGVVASIRIEGADGVVTERRLGSRVHLRVSGELVPSLSVSDVVVDYAGTVDPFAGGAATVTYTVTNTGNARLDPEAEVRVAGPFGWAAATSQDDVPELLPGSSIERTVRLDAVAALGVVTADITVAGEVVAREGVTAVPEPVLATGAASAAAVPWTALAALLVLAGAVAATVVLRRRRGSARRREIDAAVAAALTERDSADGVRATAGPDADAHASEAVGAGRAPRDG